MEKKEPLRKCIGCGMMKNKSELIRIVRDKDRRLFLDESGKAQGRGAYLCRDISCIEAALKKKRIEASLRVPAGEEIKSALRAL